MVNFFKPSTKKTNNNQRLKLAIEKLDHNGVGVGYQQKRPVFVSGALPNEQVTVKITEQKSKFVKAKLLEVDKPSEHRVAAKCRHFLQCGGCDLQHLSHQEQIAFKQQKVTELFGRNGFNNALPWQQPILATEFGYRRKARIGVQYDKKGAVTVGFRQLASNSLQSIKTCPVLLPEIAHIFQPLKSVLSELKAHKPVGHVEVIVANGIHLVIRQLVKLDKHDMKCWQAFAQEYQCKLYFDHGDEISVLSDDSDALKSINDDCSLPIEAYQLNYQLRDDSNIKFSVNNFIQVNDSVNLTMVETALDWLELKCDDQVLDLFCGLGNFTLPMAKKVSKVVGIEGVDAMVEMAKRNAESNQLKNCEFYQSDLNASWKDQTWANNSFNKVVLDPARAGAFEAVQQLPVFNAQTILYVSCDPATLARDAKALVELGYKLKKIMLMDMFSQTKHIETMVLFSLS